MTSRVEKTATIVLTVAAALVAIASVRREFFRPTGRNVSIVVPPPEYIPDWKEMLHDGVLIGDSAAPIKIVEFADLQCRFCRRFHLAFNAAKGEYGRRLALYFVHWPIQSRPHAMAAARAAECASEEGKFEEFADIVFNKQDSLGVKSWISYAREAGVRDTAKFSACASDTRMKLVRVERGLTLGSKLGVQGTPTVIINGWRFTRPPYDSLAQMIEMIEGNKAPFNHKHILPR